jgi:hypothetical protein
LQRNTKKDYNRRNFFRAKRVKLSDNVLLLQDACGLDGREVLVERIYDDNT